MSNRKGVPYQVYVDEQLYDRVRDAADTVGVNIPALVTMVFEQFVDNPIGIVSQLARHNKRKRRMHKTK